MDVEVQPGKYVVAVSGGVDSVVLLDLLSQLQELDLVVAHFDHGIRPDSADDAKFVKSLASKYGLPFVAERVELGADASEEAARHARYSFLNVVQCKHGDCPIITAHHQDDVLETAIHNLLRGTGRRGLASLRNTKDVIRPLLDTPKQQLIDYALKQKLSWREDTTNYDDRYTRNYIRNRLLVRFDDTARQQLLAQIKRIAVINDELEELFTKVLAAYSTEQGINRQYFINLSHKEAKEFLAAWLRQRGLRDFSSQMLERLTVQAKTRQVGKQFDIMRGYQFMVTPQLLALNASPLYTK